MIESGSIFCNDMYQYGEETARTIDEMGIREVICKPEIDITTRKLLENKKKVLDFVDF